jgi:hypothetical protein
VTLTVNVKATAAFNLARSAREMNFVAVRADVPVITVNVAERNNDVDSAFVPLGSRVYVVFAVFLCLDIQKVDFARSGVFSQFNEFIESEFFHRGQSFPLIALIS